MLLSMITAAFALDCAPLHPESCAAANDAAAHINATHGSELVSDDAAKVRFRTMFLYEAFEEIRQTAVGNCPVTPTIAGSYGGTYNARGRSHEGRWSTLTGSETGTAVGSIDPPTKTWRSTTLDAGATPVGRAGDDLAGYTRDGQIIGNREFDVAVFDDAFTAGRWIRLAGRTGVYATVYGDCPDVLPLDAVGGWYDGVPQLNYELELLDFNSEAPVAGATVTTGVSVATTDSGGVGHVRFVPEERFVVHVEAAGYPDVYLERWAQRVNDSSILLSPSSATVAFLASQLGISPDVTKGNLGVTVFTGFDGEGNPTYLSGAAVTADVASERAIFGTSLSPIGFAPGATTGDDGTVFLLNMAEGPVTVTVAPPAGFTCAPLESGLDDAPTATVEVHDETSFTYIIFGCTEAT